MFTAPSLAYIYTFTQTDKVVADCSHGWNYMQFDHNSGEPTFCGLCWLASFFNDEVPSRLHEYKALAENGNPQTAGRFLMHLEAALGLTPPVPGQRLKLFRLAREQYTRKPPRQHLPVTRALWDMMGSQPPLAKPLVRILLGQSEEDYCRENDISRYAFRSTLQKSVRLALRYIRR